jgi:hypothetical protein
VTGEDSHVLGDNHAQPFQVRFATGHWPTLIGEDSNVRNDKHAPPFQIRFSTGH